MKDGSYTFGELVSAYAQDDITAKRKKLFGEIGGYAGMVLLQGATLPSIFASILGTNDHLPPLSMVLMVWVGLLLYLIRAIVQNDKLYMISNGIGVVLNFILLIIIVFGGF